MIESIEIKNFRCFKDTKIAKFGLVNLIGGLNNAGKTALLEAIVLVKNPHHNPIKELWLIRGGSEQFAKENPENVWDSFFYKNNKAQTIHVNLKRDGKSINKVTITCDDNLEIDNFFPSNLIRQSQEKKYIETLVSSKKSVLHIIGETGEANIESVLVADIQGIGGAGNTINGQSYLRLPTKKRTNSELAKAFQRLQFDGKDAIVLDAVKIIDKTIEKIEFFAIGEPNLYLTNNDGVRLSLGLFGDAISTMMEIVISILAIPDRIILIDEIENGIHYTNQERFWEMLFKLAIEFNVQIFSTSHSLEMIKAFTKVAQQFPEKAAYFEMARHYKTGNIMGTSIPIDDLIYYIESNSPFRGD